jgi:uncharacterized membrane protein
MIVFPAAMPSYHPKDPSTPAHKSGPPLFARALPPLILWAGLLYLALRMPPDGREHANFAQFLGRFHPILLHLPIALLVFVPAMEILGRRPTLSYLRQAAGNLLSVAALLSYLTALDGWLLAWSGGYRGHDVTIHMWAGLSFAAACGLAARARCTDMPRFAYPVMLAVAFGLMVWAGHFGGSISHGDGYMTDKMPGRVRVLLGMPAIVVKESASDTALVATVPIKAGPGSTDPANPAYYAVHIAPLFARSCNSCHKPEKHKGGLRTDSYAQLMRGGSDGPAVIPGNTKDSEILRRVKLPPSDDDSMPSDGDKPFTAEEIQMLEHWIASGAKGS